MKIVFSEWIVDQEPADPDFTNVNELHYLYDSAGNAAALIMPNFLAIVFEYNLNTMKFPDDQYSKQCSSFDEAQSWVFAQIEKFGWKIVDKKKVECLL